MTGLTIGSMFSGYGGLDMAARGLWVSAGSYCARHLTDGAITGSQIRAIGGTSKQAEKLVAAGLHSTRHRRNREQ